ncbi:MAG: phosphoribosylformylglycinamidine synthase subunit PurS [Bryobacteraceae bacterium]
MTAHVYVSLKKTVLDPQGQTIQAALASRGYGSIEAVRQGKVFEIEVADGADADAVRKQVDEIAHEILANPVIEEYRVEWTA